MARLGQRTPPKGNWGACRLVAIALALIFAVLAIPGSKPGSLAPTLDLSQADEAFSLKAEDGFQAPKNDTLFKHKCMWQLPAAPPKGVVLFFHGCNHSATDLWEKSTLCPECLGELRPVGCGSPACTALYWHVCPAPHARPPPGHRAAPRAGLPEEVRVRLAVLRRGHAIVAVSSRDRVSLCWDLGYNPLASQDGRIAEILAEVAEREGLQGLPVYAIGGSSGGAFALLLPHLMTLQVGPRPPLAAACRLPAAQPPLPPACAWRQGAHACTPAPGPATQLCRA